jgi:hypothetical protein
MEDSYKLRNVHLNDDPTPNLMSMAAAITANPSMLVQVLILEACTITINDKVVITGSRSKDLYLTPPLQAIPLSTWDMSQT